MNDASDGFRILQAGIVELTAGDYPDTAAQTLTHYLQMLYQWNQAYNLTAIRTIDAMIDRHVFDSLAILPWIKGPLILDVGTGAGLPGIPLAVVRPEWRVVLLDSNGKKTRFLHAVKHALKLDNIEVIHARVQDYASSQTFQTIVSRAMTDVTSMIALSRHLLAAEGRWVSMKGPQVMSELAQMIYPYRVEHYTVPGIAEKRCCVIVENCVDCKTKDQL